MWTLDVAFIDSNYGVAAVVCKDKCVLIGYITKIGIVLDGEEAELHAILLGINLTAKLDNIRCWIESDCLNGANHSKEMIKGERMKEVARKIKYGCRRDAPERMPGKAKWLLPIKFEGWYRVDTDGSVKIGKVGGSGAIVRGVEGNFIDVASRVSDNLSVMYNQVQGVRLGLELAKANGLEKILLFCNSSYIYSLVNLCRCPYDEYVATVGVVLAEIRELEKCFTQVQFHVCPRGLNKAADYVSKLFKVENGIKPEFHTKLNLILNQDSTGHLHDCLW